MPDKPIEQKVRDLQEVAHRLYGGSRQGKIAYLPGGPRRHIEVVHYESDREWANVHKNHAGTYADAYVDFLKTKQRDQYDQLVGRLGSHEAVVENAKSTYLDNTRDVPAYYDLRSHTIVTRTNAINVLAHEVAHSLAAPSSNPYSLSGTKFRDLTSKALDESVTQYFGEEIASEYVRTKKSPGEDIVIQTGMYSVEDARNFVNTHGEEQTRYAYFGGVFRKQPGTTYEGLKIAGDGRQWVPAIPETPPKKRWQRYIVKPEDTLWGIAEKFNIGDLWPTIYRDNRDVIGDDPHHIRAGQSLKIPRWWIQGPAQSPPDWRMGLPRGRRQIPFQRGAQTGKRSNIGTIGPGRQQTAATTWTKPRTDPSSQINQRRRRDRDRLQFDYNRRRYHGGSQPGRRRHQTVSANWAKPWNDPGIRLDQGRGYQDGFRYDQGGQSYQSLQPRTYTIKKGDTLSGIANQFRAASQWRDLHQLNRGVLGDNPHLIHPGDQIKIPGHWRYYGNQ